MKPLLIFLALFAVVLFADEKYLMYRQPTSTTQVGETVNVGPNAAFIGDANGKLSPRVMTPSDISGVWGSGLVVTNFSQFQAAVGNAAVKRVMLGADITVTANVTILSTKNIVFNGYKLKEGSTQTISFYGGIDAGRYQIFENWEAGDIKGNFGGANILPEWWGLVGTTAADGQHDLAINAAIQTFDGSYGPIVSLGAFQYWVKKPIDLRGKKARLIGAGCSSTFLVAGTNWEPDSWEWSGVFERVLPPSGNTISSAASASAGTMTDFTLASTGTSTEVISNSRVRIASFTGGDVAYNGEWAVNSVISPTVIRVVVPYDGAVTPAVGTVELITLDGEMETGAGSAQSIVWIGSPGVEYDNSFYTGVQGMYIAGQYAVEKYPEKRIHLVAWSGWVQENTFIRDLNMGGFSGFGIGGESESGVAIINGLEVNHIHMGGATRRASLPVYIGHHGGIVRISDSTLNVGIGKAQSRDADVLPDYVLEWPQFGFFVSGLHTVVMNCHVEGPCNAYYAANNQANGSGVSIIGCDYNHLSNFGMAYFDDQEDEITGLPSSTTDQLTTDARGLMFHYSCGVSCGEYPDAGASSPSFTNGSLTVINFRNVGGGNYILRDYDYGIHHAVLGTGRYPNLPYSQVSFYSRGSYWGPPPLQTRILSAAAGAPGSTVLTVSDSTDFAGTVLISNDTAETAASGYSGSPYVTSTGFPITAVGVGTITITKPFNQTLTGHAWKQGVPYNWQAPPSPVDKNYFTGPVF